MNKSERFRALLRHGYFPQELPPPFHTRDLAKYRTSIGNAWAQLNNYKKSTPELFSFPRVGRTRRNLTLVNPVAQFHTAQLIAENWVAIAAHLRSSTLHVSGVTIDSGGRAVSPPDFSLIAERRRDLAATFDYELVSDFSRFYGTLYTHVIPWALHGKDWCKANLHLPAYQNSLGARLDRCIRKGQDDQTIGIPVGPDTSRIASEIVAAAVDREMIAERNLTRAQALRFVDDYHIGEDTLGGAERALTSLTKASRKYEIELNSEKTLIQPTKSRSNPPWPIDLRQHTFESGVVGQARSLEHYFDKAFEYASLYTSQNVLDYALKRVRSLVVYQDNWSTFETYILQAARSNSTLLPVVAELLVSSKSDGHVLRMDRISKLINDVIVSGAPSGHHAEVSWALFLAKALGVSLPARVTELLCEMESSVCALLALDLERRRLTDVPLDKAMWLRSMTGDGLYSNMWLLAYEADLKGWLNSGVLHVQGDPHFRELRLRGVSFYDEAKTVQIRRRRPAVNAPEGNADALGVDQLLPWEFNQDEWDEFLDAGYP